MDPLVIEVRLVTGEYGATGPGSEPEWPPHPYRLYAALVAAAGAHRTPADASCLEALAALDPPQVHASALCTTSPEHTVWVPSAKRDKLGQKAARHADRLIRPTVDLVRFEWSSPGAVPRRVLSDLASRVSYLGRASSLAIVSVPDRVGPLRPDVRTWAPTSHADAEIMLRVPRPGLLDELDQAFTQGLDASSRRPPPLAGYRRVGPSPVEVEGPWDRVACWRLAEGTIPARFALRACDALHKAVLAAEGDGCPAEISGHRDGGPFNAPHAAWLALVDVGHRHATGRVLGFGAALPEGTRLPVVPDRLHFAGRQFRLTPVDESRRPAATLTSWRWARPAHRWATATPIALPWTGRRADRSAPVRAVRAACRRAGFPAPVEVVVDDAAFLDGPEPASRYLRARPDQTARRACHATLRFADPVQGPVVIGPLRHFGLGLLAPLDPP